MCNHYIINKFNTINVKIIIINSEKVSKFVLSFVLKNMNCERVSVKIRYMNIQCTMTKEKIDVKLAKYTFFVKM